MDEVFIHYKRNNHHLTVNKVTKLLISRIKRIYFDFTSHNTITASLDENKA